jgi:hypothetical protein
MSQTASRFADNQGIIALTPSTIARMAPSLPSSKAQKLSVLSWIQLPTICYPCRLADQQAHVPIPGEPWSQSRGINQDAQDEGWDCAQQRFAAHDFFHLR